MTYTGISRGVLSSFFGDGINACGHAAAATCLDYYKILPFSAKTPSEKAACVKAMYNRSPPDTSIPGTNFGCTPGHVDNICRLYHLSTDRFNSRTPDPAGHLKKTLGFKQPTIVLVDNGKLGGGWATCHYLVAFGYDDKNVYVQNSIQTNGEAVLPWGTFNDAWHTWFIPEGEFQYSAIATGKA